ncbi:MAG: hypothetical protein GTO60_04595 [Gammaproteobacteria bacterium]|nr:hypothetical protein [Gammaproteobacteria bacterium]NIO63631.1 hypothetical protein [Gammaproteobacteria bacterium]
MTESYPENKTCQVGTPHCGVVHPGCANAIIKLEEPGEEEAHKGDGGGNYQGGIVFRSGN